MVEARLALEPEVQEIFECIDRDQNFLLSGGAGSGKTYSLVQVIRQVILENSTAKVACMTYTNAAVKEIEERVNHSHLNVTTIHDFLWDNIKHFQKELRKALVELANDEEVTKISIQNLNPVPDNFFDGLENGIQYKEYLRVSEGIISHDELLLVANYLFEKYSKICDIVKDKYKYIFIDEYQDTNKVVIEIFLNHLKKSKKQNIIGFFGDAMQSIYDEGIGNLDAYKGEDVTMVKEVKKSQNRRSPQKVIDLANLLRTDGIIQVPSNDPNAPNMCNGQVKEGKVLFFNSANDDIETVKKSLSNTYGWNFDDTRETKELNLTHSLIADKAGFRTLMDIYDKDQIIGFRDRIKKYIREKGIATEFTNKTFREVIEILQQGKSGRELNAVKPTNGMQIFIDSHPALYTQALGYNYQSFSKIYINKDQLLDDKKQDQEDENKKGSKRDNLVKHLFKIQTNIRLYKEGQYNEFLRVTDYKYKIKGIEDKRILKDSIEGLINVGEKTIEEVIVDANEKGICLIDDKLKDFKVRNEYVYNQVKDLKFKEFQKLYEYLEGKTPFSTQHKTKGSEFDNVLVILDNGGWNNYNFENLFIGTGTQSVLERTQKIFYVCCTRAKENLAVFYFNPKTEVVAKAIEWFGNENVFQI